jgi:hypothetical protein
MKKQTILILILLLSIVAHGQTVKTAHFGSISDTVGCLCKIDSAHALTIEAWVNNNDSTSALQHDILYYVTGDFSGHSESLEWYIKSNVLSFTIYHNVPSFYTNTLSHPITSGWHHIATTLNSTSGEFLFIDGIKVDSQSAMYVATDTSYVSGLYIGCKITGPMVDVFDGNIDNVRITPSVLYTGNFSDTCYYAGSYIYAALNDIDSTHIVVNSVPTVTRVPVLTNISPCFNGTLSTGIVGSEIEDDIIVSPNPTQNSFIITSLTPIKTVDISNLIGQRVLTSAYNDKQVKIDFEQMPKGIYLLRINKDRVYKIVKQ